MRYFAAALLLSACSEYVPAPLVGQERQDAYASYVDGINQKLKDVWNPKQAFHDYPSSSFSAGKATTVVFAIIDGQGNLITASAKHTDHELLDREAIRAVYRSAPFAPPPNGLLQRDMQGSHVTGRGLYAVVPLQFSLVIPGPPGSWSLSRYLAKDMNDVTVTPSELYLEL